MMGISSRVLDEIYSNSNLTKPNISGIQSKCEAIDQFASHSINLQGIQINLNLTFVEWHSKQHHLSVIANLDSNMEHQMVKDKLPFTAGYL